MPLFKEAIALYQKALENAQSLNKTYLADSEHKHSGFQTGGGQWCSELVRSLGSQAPVHWAAFCS